MEYLLGQVAPPSDGNWEGWIITIAVSVIMTLGTTIVGLARMVKDLYAKTIADLEARTTKLEDIAIAVNTENSKLREENAGLRAKVEMLEKVDF